MSAYARSSLLDRTTGGANLSLETALGATPAGLVDHPSFFSGFVGRPDVLAAALLAVTEVAATRYADHGLAQRLANLDPVVTGSGDRLRFESFSACNGVHARFDLLADGIDAGEVGFGTTNIDINQPLRNALESVRREEMLHMDVGVEGLQTSTLKESHQEERVQLDERWIRGLAEVPGVVRDMELRATLTPQMIGVLLRGLPKSRPPGPSVFVIATRSGVRMSSRPLPGAVHLAGTTRLRSLYRVGRFITSLQVFTDDVGATAWVATLPGGRLTLVLTAAPYRSFSGDGSLLTLLTDSRGETAGRALLGQLAWQPVIDPTVLVGEGIGQDEVAAGLAWLAASGRLGFDLTEQAWFHRDLPVDAEKVVRRNPRLVSAQKLVGEGGVTSADGFWRVSGTDRPFYEVRTGQRGYHCECAWERDHHGSRGPCKHILAVVIQERAAPAGQG